MIPTRMIRHNRIDLAVHNLRLGVDEDTRTLLLLHGLGEQTPSEVPSRIDWPGEKLALVIEAEPVFGHVVIYVPKGEDYFCVEPVSHVNDGFNRLAMGETDTGVVVLDPGQTLDGTVRLSAEAM